MSYIAVVCTYTLYRHNIPIIPFPHFFFSPPSTFCTLPPTAPSGLKFLPIMPSLARGPPTFSPTLPMAPSLVKAPPMVPFASKAAGALLSVGFWPLGGDCVSMIEMMIGLRRGWESRWFNGGRTRMPGWECWCCSLLWFGIGLDWFDWWR